MEREIIFTTDDGAKIHKYDVLDVRWEGTEEWKSFSTLRTDCDAEVAVSMCRGTGHYVWRGKPGAFRIRDGMTDRIIMTSEGV